MSEKPWSREQKPAFDTLNRKQVAYFESYPRQASTRQSPSALINASRASA